MKWFVILLAVILLFTACTQKIEQTSTTTLGDNKESVLVELRLINNKFDPTTIVVNEGDSVRFQFMNTNIFHFSFPEFNIDENINGNQIIDFVANKKGAYIFSCDDCENKAEGLLRVV